ncbi:MAG: hypothetical protein MZU97_21865 [Bacillus subtilis]|nr:hypothetical protein [Bacillus subtilis]
MISFSPKAKAKGIEDVQVYLVNRSELSMEVFAGELDKYEIADTASFSIKGVYQKKMATYVTEDLGDELIDQIIDNLIQNALVIDSLDEAIIYAGDEHYEQLDGLVQRKSRRARRREENRGRQRSRPACSTRRIRGSPSRKRCIPKRPAPCSCKTPKGLKLQNKVNSAMLGGSIIAKDESDQRTGFDLIISNDFADFDLPKIAAEARWFDVVKKLGADTRFVQSRTRSSSDKDALRDLDVGVLQRVLRRSRSKEHEPCSRANSAKPSDLRYSRLVDDPFLKKSVAQPFV